MSNDINNTNNSSSSSSSSSSSNSNSNSNSSAEVITILASEIMVDETNVEIHAHEVPYLVPRPPRALPPKGQKGGEQSGQSRVIQPSTTTPSPPTKSFPTKSPRVELAGRPPIKFYGHENSHPLELRVCLSQTL